MLFILFLSGIAYHIECEVLKDTVVPVFVCFCKVTPSDIFPDSKMVAFLLMCIQSNNQVSKTFTVAQLSEHQSKKLISTGKMLNILVAIILLYDTEKLVIV